VSPYTKIPASQAVSMPIYVKIANNASDVAVAFPIRVQIVGPDGETKYWQTQTVTSIRGNSDSVIQMPNWNAANATIGGAQEYVVHAWIAQEGYDSYEDDNGTYTKFNLMVEQEAGLTQEFAYDDAGMNPQVNEGNDIPALTLLTGQGIGFANNSGSFATKFRLVTKDTLYGVRVYFGNANQSPDAIRVSVLEGNPSSATPGDLVVQPGVETVFQTERKGDFFNKFWPYYFKTPIVLPGGVDAPGTQGVYWISIGQLSLDNMVMGGDISRGGGLVRVSDLFTPSIVPIYNTKYGTQASSNVNNGDVSSAWALEVTASTGNWAGWMPSNGWWPTNQRAGNPLAWVTNYNTTYFVSGGSYTPMIRPLVSRSIMLPVEFAVPLQGEPTDDGKALLTWTTATEKNNMGFYVERQNAVQAEAMWEKLGFVGSKTTNSSTPTGYSYVDANVTPGTYNYRIIQTDVDGAESVSNTVKVGINAPNQYSLSAAYPNPFAATTRFSVSVPAAGPAVVEVYNAIGQVVKTIFNGELPVGSSPLSWDGKDEAGNQLSAGTYLVRVTSGAYTETMKVTLTK
ncbi:MAG TPA: FlgD immunoglobulin-like domain containing protein, partial [Candidatus Kapabacteria bacterium]|nr:FlgD immunoglobulin-like domain containing protein [Candidatus Kapabacteria bacterium]